MNDAGVIMMFALGVRSIRESLLAENIANSDVPGYLPRDIDFTHALERAVAGASEGDTASSPPESTRVVLEDLRGDGSGVDVAKELGSVFENSISYIATMKLFGDMMGRLKTAIT